MISKFAHGDHNVASQDMLQTELTVQYEAVKYLEGKVTHNTAGGFIDLHYDNTPSPYSSYPGTTQNAPQYATNTTTITDLANSQTAIFSRSELAVQTKTTSPSAGVAPLLSQVTTGMGSAGGNAGGYSIPNLGSLTQGVTGSAVLGKQLQSAGVGLIGSATSQLANGITGAVAKGLGPNGNTIVGLAAAAIANPNQALKTIENMATAVVLGIGMNYINNKVQEGVNFVSGKIENGVSTGVDKLSTTFSWGDAGTFQNSLSQSYNNWSMGAGWNTNAQLQDQFNNNTGIYAKTDEIGGVNVPYSSLNE
jgi:hypothetical protein